MIEKIITGVVILVILYLLYVLLKYFKFFENRHITSQISADNNYYEVPFDDWCPSGTPSPNFALSIWFYVTSWDTSNTKYLFERIDNENDTEISAYLGSTSNDLTVEFHDTSSSAVVTLCEVNNIPLQKWIHLCVVRYDDTLDLYIDGKLIKSCVNSGSTTKSPVSKPIILHGKYSDGVAGEQGFDGYTTHLKYFNSTLAPNEVYNIYKNGYGGSFLDSLLGGYKMRMSLFRNEEEIAGVGLG